MKFNIIQKYEFSYKQEIISFWEKYLPGTPPERFDWMTKGNPAGLAIWFFAFEENTGELAGMISLMPRTLFINGQVVRAGIMGDLTVADRYRVFGPALQLIKTAITNMPELGMEFIYTIPNRESEKLIERAGFKKAIKLKTYAKPISLFYYLKKYFPTFIAKIAAPLFDAILRLFFRESNISTDGVFEEVDAPDGLFDEFWEKIRSMTRGPIGEHNLQFINWRYSKNPMQPFRIISYKEDSKKLSGYIIFSAENNRIEIYDIVSLNDRHTDILLKKTIEITRKGNFQSIYFTVLDNGEWAKKLRSFGFFDAKNYIDVYYFLDSGISLDGWNFFQGDRNI